MAHVMLRKLILWLLMAAVFIFGAQGPAKAATLKMVYPQKPVSLDPHAADPAAVPVVMAAYSRLLTLEAGTGKVVPSLISTYKISEDGRIYTFVLKEGLTFSDGYLVDTDAAFFSFDRLMSTEAGARYFSHLKRFEPMGPYTFRLILDEPWPPFMAALALPQASLVSPGYRDKSADYLKTRTLGSGRYMVEDWTDEALTMKIRGDLSGKPHIHETVFYFEPDPAARFKLFMDKEAHMAVDPKLPQEALPPQYVLKDVPSFTTRLAALNVQRPYFQKSNARQALAALLRAVFKDHPRAAMGEFPLHMADDYRIKGADGPDGYGDYDGTAILKEIGPPAQPLVVVVTEPEPEIMDAVRRVISALEEAGVKAELLYGDLAAPVLAAGSYDLLFTTRTPETTAPEMWLGQLLDSQASAQSNPAYFKDRLADNLILEMTAASPNDKEAQKQKVMALAALMRNQTPYVLLYQEAIPLLLDRRLVESRDGGLSPHPMWPTVWPIDITSLKPFSGPSLYEPKGEPAAEKKRPELTGETRPALGGLSLAGEDVSPKTGPEAPVAPKINLPKLGRPTRPEPPVVEPEAVEPAPASPPAATAAPKAETAAPPVSSSVPKAETAEPTAEPAAPQAVTVTPPAELTAPISGPDEYSADPLAQPPARPPVALAPTALDE